MKSKTISQSMERLKSTKNPIYILQILYLLINQGRLLEAVHSIYCRLFFRPSPVMPHPKEEVDAILEYFKGLPPSKDDLSREELIGIFQDGFAVQALPEDFFHARIEGIVYDPDFLIIGEYGSPGKRVAHVTREECTISDYYVDDHTVRHIHAIFKDPQSPKILISTGDSSKYLDEWRMDSGEFTFIKRLRKDFAGHLAMALVQGHYYLGTDFSHRPNYIECLDGRKFFFPEPASNMYVLRFHPYQSRYIVSLNTELFCLGGRHSLSIFDTQRMHFIFCGFYDYPAPKSADLALHRQEILRRSGAAEPR